MRGKGPFGRKPRHFERRNGTDGDLVEPRENYRPLARRYRRETGAQNASRGCDRMVNYGHLLTSEGVS